jgi:hypothetical protein
MWGFFMFNNQQAAARKQSTFKGARYSPLYDICPIKFTVATGDSSVRGSNKMWITIFKKKIDLFGI